MVGVHGSRQRDWNYFEHPLLHKTRDQVILLVAIVATQLPAAAAWLKPLGVSI
jgi:hypothetical protein